MSFWVYILRCADNSYYTGHTDNLEDRIAKHKTGEIEGYTSTRLPVTLVFSEEFPTREEALACEQQIKGWSRSKKGSADARGLGRGLPVGAPSPFEDLRVTGFRVYTIRSKWIKIQDYPGHRQDACGREKKIAARPSTRLRTNG
jgi:putative endonuclease